MEMRTLDWVSIFLLVGVMGFLYYDFTMAKEELEGVKESYLNINRSMITDTKDIIYNCAHTTNILDSVKCFNEEVKKIYKYNLTDDNITLNVSQLKERGGDCKNWATLYELLGQKKGYNTKAIIIPIDKGSSHRFAVIYNDEGYCIADQKRIFCVEYEQIN